MPSYVLLEHRDEGTARLGAGPVSHTVHEVAVLHSLLPGHFAPLQCSTRTFPHSDPLWQMDGARLLWERVGIGNREMQQWDAVGSPHLGKGILKMNPAKFCIPDERNTPSAPDTQLLCAASI